MSVTALKIGTYQLPGQVVLAPMSGISDAPFRDLCTRFGASATFSEMITSDYRLWHNDKTQKRLAIQQQHSPRCIQLLGAEPQKIAEAAKLCADLGADIIDINMGCPAKKVCQKAAGSALLQDISLVADILDQVVNSVTVPVTLKFRTGWNGQQKNAVAIAKLAENIGIQALTLHGRTAQDKFNGQAEHNTVAEVVQAVSIPVIANGDIHTPEQAKKILDQTGAAGIMIGRSAQGMPWIFRDVHNFLVSGIRSATFSLTEIYQTIIDHLHAIHEFYGESLGVRIGRKHLGWYLDKLSQTSTAKSQMYALTTRAEQVAFIHTHFQSLLRYPPVAQHKPDLKTNANGEVLAA